MAAAPQPEDLEVFDFDRGATYWDALYDAADFHSLAYYRSRLQRTLAWVDELALPPGAHVLDIGFGAGRSAVALAQRGLLVTGVDTGERMLELGTRAAVSAGLEDRISLSLGDAEALAFPDSSFALVIALGVIPWLERPGQGMREMARVTAAGGHVIASANNRRQLNRVLDPRLNPVTDRAKRFALHTAHRLGRDLWTPAKVPRHDSRRQFELWIRACGLQPQRHATLGFGRFSLLARPLLSQTASIRLHERLQARADAGFPILSSSGAQLLILSNKPKRFATTIR
jgi:ubiquinone/menaquinone biosynthesis C-methylase UbiE